jgi:integral membrane protein
VKALSTAALVRVFRVLAIAEALSWAALLAGMYFKWIAKTTELGVEIAGPIHGALFIGYGLTALVLWRQQRWPFLVALFAGFSAVLPFATVLFERWAGNRGYLSAAGTTPAERQAVADVRSIREPAGEETADV